MPVVQRGSVFNSEQQLLEDTMKSGVDVSGSRIAGAEHGAVQAYVLVAGDVWNVDFHTVVVDETLAADGHGVGVAAVLE